MKKFIDSLNERFLLIHSRSLLFVQNIPDDKLYFQPQSAKLSFPVNSCGEHILRSAGKVEQTFGGITAKLWDDPFEWTLPETLSTSKQVLGYLSEVEETRKNGFALFQTDDDLRREIPAPEKLKSIFSILIETLAVAEHFQGRAFAVFSVFSEEKLPKI